MKIKGLFSILLAMVLFCSCVCISASAASTATISLKGEANAVIGTEYKVSLTVSESAADLVGGISCVVGYDTDKFELKRVEITSAFAGANRIESGEYNKVARENDGKISVALLDVDGDSAQGKWLTFVFEVLESEGSANFTVSNAKASNAAGTTLVTSDMSVDITASQDGTIDFHKPQTNINGASIKKDVKDGEGNVVGNIRFEAQLDESIEKNNIAEIGFLLLPTKLANNGDLTFTGEYDSSGTYPLYTMANGQKVSISQNGISIDQLKNTDGKFYCYFEGTLNYPLDLSYSARHYVKLKDGTYVYGYNENGGKNITRGTSSRSCVEVAKAIYELYKNDYNFTQDVTDIIGKQTAWNATDYQTVVNALAACEESLH